MFIRYLFQKEEISIELTVSVCQKVSTTAHFPFPTTLWYHSQASGLMGSPTLPSTFRELTSWLKIINEDTSVFTLQTMIVFRWFQTNELISSYNCNFQQYYNRMSVDDIIFNTNNIKKNSRWIKLWIRLSCSNGREKTAYVYAFSM